MLDLFKFWVRKIGYLLFAMVMFRLQKILIYMDDESADEAKIKR